MGPRALEAILRSDALSCTAESEPYYLMNDWLEQSPRVSNDEDFDWTRAHQRLIRQVRFRHMHKHYAASVLPVCPHLTDADLTHAAMHEALAGDSHHGGDFLDRSSPPNQSTWTVRTTIALADCVRLTGPGHEAISTVGLVAGYPVTLSVQRLQGDGGGGKFNLRTQIHTPRWGHPTFFPNHNHNDPRTGVPIKCRLHIGEEVIPVPFSINTSNYPLGRCWRWVVQEGSSTFFPGKRMAVTLTFRMANKGEN